MHRARRVLLGKRVSLSSAISLLSMIRAPTGSHKENNYSTLIGPDAKNAKKMFFFPSVSSTQEDIALLWLKHSLKTKVRLLLEAAASFIQQCKRNSAQHLAKWHGKTGDCGEVSICFSSCAPVWGIPAVHMPR